MFPLRFHTDFSLLRSTTPVPKAVKALKEFGYPGAAITDFGVGFGWVDFFFKMKSEGLKPILGAHLELPLIFASKAKGGVSFLARNRQGYQNLSKILSAYSFGTLSFEQILQWQDSLVLLLSPDHPHLLEKEAWLKDWSSEQLYFEVHRYEGAPSEDSAVQAAALWKAKNIATQPIYYIRPEEHLAHEIVMSIGAGTNLMDEKHPQLVSKDFYLKTPDEMKQIFSDHPEWIQETLNIADRVDFKFETDTYHLPSIGSDDVVNKEFESKCFAGLDERLNLIFETESEIDQEKLRAEYEDRLKTEIKIIEGMKFPGYFLIVADFIQWSKSNGIPVGPGRGSGAGSLAAYCLKITDIDPIKYNLLFERFLNPERVSMPDFDVDFCIKGRDKVIQYVREKYNLAGDLPLEEKLKVSQIITYGKMKSKAVIRDVGRALGIPYSDVDAIAKLVPNVLNISLQEAFEMEPEFEALRDRDPKADQLLRLAEDLEGLNRHSSVHAAGVVIADDLLTKYLPLYRNSDEEIVCQYEMKAVEKIGLIKFDFLGLRNLTVIQECIRLTGKPIDLLKINYNDPKVMSEISTGETVGIFQLESSGMRDVIRRLQPSQFEDLIAIVALYRPGPLEGGMVDDFILRKRGQKAVSYPAEVLKPLLEETYGVFVYQEQVMGTANRMAGYSLGEADLLRRAMGKKIPEEMAKQRERFVQGAIQNGHAESLAQQIFDLMAEFAKYGFNKSHAAAYAMVTFQTAYLKTYYPEAFFAALLSSESEDIEKIGGIIRTAQKRGIEVLPPSVNYSEVDFDLEERNSKTAVRFGLSAIKNLGVNVAAAIVEERNSNGKYKSAEDFFFRIPSQMLNKRQCECLIRSGALDEFELTRASLFASLDNITGEAQAQAKARQAGQTSLFKRKPKIKELDEWPDRIRLNDEKHLLGTYMTGHPLQGLSSILTSYQCESIQKYLEGPVPAREKEIQLAGLVSSKKEIITKKGTKMAFFSLEDMEAQIEVVMFSDLYSRKGDQIVTDRLLLVRGQVVRENGSTRLLAREVSDISQASFTGLCLRLKSRDYLPRLKGLMEEIKKFEGDIQFSVEIPAEENVEGASLKSSYVSVETPVKVQSHPKFIAWIEQEFGKASVRFIQ